MKSSRMLASLGPALALALSGCGATDVVGKIAITSFNAVAEISAAEGRLAWKEDAGAWSLGSPAGDELLLSSDFSRDPSVSGRADLRLSFDAAPFLAAGLDLGKLPPAPGLRYSLEDGRFSLAFELGAEPFRAEAGKSIEAAFAELVRTERKRIGYHAALDHYGIALGNGNMFEWAKDRFTNDKDIVFVLDPSPFLAAGLDPASIEGWVFAKVKVDGGGGKMTEVDKLLRPFNLE